MLHDVGSRPIQESNLPTVPLLIMTVSLFTRCPAKSMKCPAILYECRKNCTEFPGKMHYGISLVSASVLSYRAVHPYFGKCIAVNMDWKKCGTFSWFRCLSADIYHMNILSKPNEVVVRYQWRFWSAFSNKMSPTVNIIVILSDFWIKSS